MSKGSKVSVQCILMHLEKLNFKSKESYLKWCTVNGFRCALEKTHKELSKELKFVKYLAVNSVLAVNNYKKKGLSFSLKQMKNGMYDDHYGCPALGIYDAFKIVPEDSLDFFVDFFSYIDKKSKLLGDEKGQRILIKVFSYRDWFIRDWSSWVSKSHNRDKQLSSLVRHLFTKYEIPKFMDSAWNDGGSGDREIDWFFEMSNGVNIRKCKELPFTLTKKIILCAN